MTILSAIKIAIENGYKHEVFNLETMIKDDMLDPDTINSILLDRNFWIALGSGLNWGYQRSWLFLKNAGKDKKGENELGGKIGLKPDWLYYWEDFIDHLASNKSIPDFFEQLK